MKTGRRPDWDIEFYEDAVTSCRTYLPSMSNSTFIRSPAFRVRRFVAAWVCGMIQHVTCAGVTSAAVRDAIEADRPLGYHEAARISGQCHGEAVVSAIEPPVEDLRRRIHMPLHKMAAESVAGAQGALDVHKVV